MKKLLVGTIITSVAFGAIGADLRSVDVHVVRLTLKPGAEAYEADQAQGHSMVIAESELLQKLSERGTVQEVARGTAVMNGGVGVIDQMAGTTHTKDPETGVPYPLGLSFRASGGVIDGQPEGTYRVSFFEQTGANKFTSGGQSIVLPESAGVATGGSLNIANGSSVFSVSRYKTPSYTYIIVTPHVQ